MKLKSCCNALSVLLQFSTLLSRASAQDNVVISEFMAANDSTLADEDGSFEDWIEVHNPMGAAVNLLGWRLTDNAADLAKWTFPPTNLPPGGYLIVFASGKDRRLPGAPLHTSFALSSGGEFLALVHSNGTVVSRFDPAFPAQVPDVSFGFGQELRFTTNLTLGATGRVLIPTDGALGTNWTLPEFSDSTWAVATNGIGYDTKVSELNFGGAATTTLESGPVAFWRLDETNGATAKNQGSLGPTADGTYFNGAVQGAAGPRPPTFNGFEPDNLATHFDGSNDKVDALYHPGLNPPQFTVECWARVTGGAGTYRSPVTSRGDNPQRGYLFYASAGNRWEFWSGTGQQTGWTTIAGPTVVNNVWVFLSGSCDGTMFHFYLNGAKVGSATAAFGPNNSNPLRIGAGRTETAGDYFFNGEVDEVAVFNRALPDAEILGHFQAATNAAGSGTITNTGPSHFAGLIQTDVRAAMLDRSPGAYVRIPFVISNLAEVNRLKLRMKYDDAFVAYVNGFEAASANAPTSPAWNSTAVTRRQNIDAVVFEEFNLEDAVPFLRVGTNVLALHGLNYGATNADFLLLPELEVTTVVDYGVTASYFTAPTPGLPNGSGNAVIGPVIRDAAQSTVNPESSEGVVVTARVLPAFAPVLADGVTLHYRVMFGVTNTLRMFDDGAHRDGVAGDGVYGAAIPAGTGAAGQMVRWFVTARDALGRISRWPIFPDPDNSPAYEGLVVRDPAVTSALPIWEWFAPDYTASHNRTGTRGAVFFEGEFYDNVYVRQRGGFTAQATSQKFDFNTGYHCRINEEIGAVEEANLNGNGADPSYLRPPVGFEIFRTAGHEASACVPMLMRYNGAADRVGLFIEQVDERFLRRYGLDDQGALYKFVQRAQLTPAFSDTTDGIEKKTRLDEDKSDLQAVVDALQLTNNIDARAAFLFDNLNLAGVVNYLASRAVVRHTDDVRKNWYFYRDTRGTREWTFFPWDMDYSLGLDADAGEFAKHPFLGDAAHRKPNALQWSMMWEAIFNDPRIRPMYLRRLRTLIDQQLGPVGYLEGRIDYWFAPAFPHLGNTVSNQVNALKNHIAQRRTELYVTFAATNTAAGVNALIPESQPPNAVVNIGAVVYNPVSGNQAEEYVCLTNPAPFAVDLSGWRLEGAVQHDFAPGTVIRSNDAMYVSPDVVAFRARTTGPRGGQRLFVQGNYRGQLSARGETLRLVDTFGRVVRSLSYAGNPSLAQQHLRITEFMYHPLPATDGTNGAEELEYVELRNISPGVTLDLTGIRFVNGIAFTFTGGTLAPGQRVLVVKNLAAFTSRYGGGLNIGGEYAGYAGGYLDNGGERVQLVDAQGEEILDFSYRDGWHPVTDGHGFSLVVVEENAEPDLWNSKANWRASGSLNGSPGAAEPAVPHTVPVVINEVLSRTDVPPPTDSIELHNPTTTNANIGGWFLTDDFNTPKKYRIANGTTLAAGGYVVFTEAEFNPAPGVPPSFALSSRGDEVYLFSGDAATNLTGYVRGFDFGAADDGVSFGRYVTSEGNERLVAQSSLTLNGANSGPRVGPLVIGEIMYHPAEVEGEDNSVDEFVEVVNLTGSPVLLYDPGAPTNRWKVTGGIDYVFPENQSMGAGEYLLLVNFDPTNTVRLDAFRAKYGVSVGVKVYGPYEGRLNNAGDNVELKKPATAAGGSGPYVLMDKVEFGDRDPWPAEADGYGLSLQRLVLGAYGNDPTNWVAAWPTAAGPRATGGLAPTITVQPASRSVLASQSITFTVEASGSTPLRYQWLFNGRTIGSATDSLLQLAGVEPSQAGEYSVLAYNDYGAVVSTGAVLTVISPAFFLAHPQSVYLVGSTNVADYGNTTNGVATFNVLAYSPTPLSYQWRFNGTPIPGATAASLTVAKVNLTHQGYYDAVATDDSGSIASARAYLGILLMPVIVVNPLDQVVPMGGTFSASVQVLGGPPPFMYQWRRGSGIVQTDVSDSTNAVFTYGPVTGMDGTTWRLALTNAASPVITRVTKTFTVTVQTDFDQDGLPDAWEVANGFSTNEPANASLDLDGDGMTLAQEYVAGTDWNDPASYLRIDRISVPGAATLEFMAVAQRTYSIEYTDDPGRGMWTRLIDVVAMPTNRAQTVLDPASCAPRFYRLVTPKTP